MIFFICLVSSYFNVMCKINIIKPICLNIGVIMFIIKGFAFEFLKFLCNSA
jgi:hypothetical protein